MHTELTDSDTQLQRQLHSTSKFVRGFLSLDPQVLGICDELGYEFRNRIYNPMITVWMFITQVISADKSCQMAITRLNAWRVAKGFHAARTLTRNSGSAIQACPLFLVRPEFDASPRTQPQRSGRENPIDQNSRNRSASNRLRAAERSARACDQATPPTFSLPQAAGAHRKSEVITARRPRDPPDRSPA